MCGICGTIGLKNNEAVSRMVKSMAHRGPDDAGMWESEGVCLGHTRLSIIDTSACGHQPMCNEDGTVWIVFNGEIYNFGELRKELINKGHRFHSSTDTEVIIHLYEEMGEACLSKLRGMFAFAIWDMKQKKLFAARDHLGIKPFFYAFDKGVFVFASELRSLLSSRAISRDVNLDAVHDYFVYGSVQSPDSLIQGVKEIPSGHYLVLKNEELILRQYWRIDTRAFSDFKISERTFKNSVSQALERSVKSQLVSDVPLGVFLSGGIDSSILSLLAQWNSVKPIRTFSVIFEESEFNEDRYSSAMAEALGTQHTKIFINPAEIIKDIPAILDAMDQPSCDGFNTYVISKAVKNAGIKVVLSGIGGDELFAGYRHFSDLPFLFALNRKMGFIPWETRRRFGLFLSRKFKHRFAQKAIQSLLACKDLTDIYLLKRSVFFNDDVRAILPSVSRDPRSFYNLDIPQDDVVNILSYLEITTYLQNTLLTDADRMSMANSIEIRPPFLDHLFVENIFRLPGYLKLRFKGGAKGLLVSSLKDVLPQSIAKRRKHGFIFPFDSWLRDGALKEYCADTILMAKDVPFIDKEHINKIWQGFLKDSKEHNYSAVLTIVSFINWYKKNIGP